MDGLRTSHQRRVHGSPLRGRAGAAGIAIGVLAGILTILTGTAVAQKLAPSEAAPVLEATHLPPLLTVAGERVELRYDVFCAAAGADAAGACKATGSVFVRSGSAGRFRPFALRETLSADGRYSVSLPDAVAHAPAGFSYYAVFHTPAGTVTVPEGGATAPQRSLPLGKPIHVPLGAHVFGDTAHSSARVAEAVWGSGPSQVGLEQGKNMTPIGGASFDVTHDGKIHVLDEANRRVLRWSAGSRSGPVAVPLAINGTLADLSVADDGTMHVLETTSRRHDTHLLRSFAANGAAAGVTEIAGQASQVRLASDGVPMVLQQPSGQWMPAAEPNGRLLEPETQVREATSARPLARGNEVVVLRHGEEIRIALTAPEGTRRSWRITSTTPLAEVQLADVSGSHLVIVARVYTDTRDEFVALVLGPGGLVHRLALDSADWAETAPLSRFRLRGSSLYQLGSTPAGPFVDRFDLEVK